MTATFDCQCGEPECQTQIRVSDNYLILVDKSGETSLMYLDANTIVGLIKELRELLLTETNAK